MKEDTKHNIKQAIETLLIGVICSAFVISMNQSCSNTVNKWTNNKKTESTNPQNIQKNVVNLFKESYRAR